MNNKIDLKETLKNIIETIEETHDKHFSDNEKEEAIDYIEEEITNDTTLYELLYNETLRYMIDNEYINEE